MVVDGTQSGRTHNVSACYSGDHLIIDCYGGSFEQLNSRELVVSCLDGLHGLFGLKKFSDPYVYYVPHIQKDAGGWSGFIMTLESHISIHIFPARGFLRADVYVCKNDVANSLVESYFKNIFCLKAVEIKLIKKGQ
jgi:S-adenosylmethionine decarboxylase